MADKGDNEGSGKPSLSSNPFLLPTSTSAPSLVFGTVSQTSKKNLPKDILPTAYGAMTSSTNTLARNLFSGSCTMTSMTTSTSSSMSPVTSFQSTTFGGSAFKGYDSADTAFSASTVNNPSGSFSVESGLVKPGVSSFPVFGGGKTEMSAYNEMVYPVSTAKVPIVSSSAHVFGLGDEKTVEASGDAGLPKPADTLTVSPFGGTISRGSITFGFPSSQAATMPSVFGELPSHTSSHITEEVSESLSSSTAPTDRIFGGSSGTSQRKTGERSTYASVMEANMFGGVSSAPTSVQNTVLTSFSSSGPFVTSEDICMASPATVFGSVSNATVAKTMSMGTVAPTVFGGVSSVLSPGDAFQSVYATSSKASLFGGVSESSPSVGKPMGSTSITSSGANVFGGTGRHSSVFSSTAPSVPRVFGGFPTESKTPSTSSIAPAASVHVVSVPGPHSTSVPNVFDDTHDSLMTGMETIVTSVMTPAPISFTGKPTDVLVGNISTVTTAPAHTGESSICIAVVEPLVKKTVAASIEVTKAEEILSGGSSSLDSKGKDFSAPSSIFGGPSMDKSHVPKVFGGSTTDECRAPKLFGDDIFGGTTVKDKAVEEAKVVTTESGKLVPSNLFTPSTMGSVRGTIPSTVFGGSLSEKQDTKPSKAEPPTASTLFGGSVSEKQDNKPSKAEPPTASTLFGGSVSEKQDTKPSKAEPPTASTLFGGSLSEKQDTKPSKAEPPTASTLFGGSLSEIQDPKQNKTDSVKSIKKEQSTRVEDSLSSQELVNVSEPLEKEKDRASQINSILSNELFDLFGKDDAKLTPTSPTVGSPPQYDKKELTKIIVAQIPESCMDKDIIKRHFQKFGHVKRVFLNPRSNQATVQYDDHRGASRAKRKGQKIHPNLPEVKIFYGAPARRKSEDSTSEAKLSKRKAIKTLQQSHPGSDGKPPSDLDPYTPLERPSGASPSLPVIKHWKNEVASKTIKASKLSTIDVRSKPKISKQSANSRPVLAPKVSLTSSRSASPKITRIESPKPARLKLEEKVKTSSRSVSPAREYNVFTEIKNIKAVMESRALNSGDKYNVLKARDKLMRNEKKRTSDIKKATFLDATCPDMCPELERYMRDVQNDLSSYEVSNGILDHKLVIKKFSRSSADKDEPLPHELRPGPVLLRTMDFLVCNIIVLCDRKDIDIGIWYNYLWDRTRAVRNDITQQQLTNGLAVTIIERCVRFHIYTAVHLCEESSDVFDRKLNTENLTKSLQTLKELYKDLAEMGKYFPSEAEFRAYEMLLHLNDGEKIVHQYSQYRDEVQKSPDVIYALKVFLALKSNNYVRFFKLIKSGSYLQGCILHRYFQQVRSKALDTYIKAYGVSKQVSVPLPIMIKTLGFEGRADATNYLSYHGIKVDEETVVLDKGLIDLHPEGHPPMTRPMKLIESNRLFSVGEVIQGGPIPKNPLHSHIPHDSFDNEGFLKSEAKDASDQRRKLQSLLSGADQPTLITPVPSKMSDDNQTIESIIKAPHPTSEIKKVVPESAGLSDHDFMTFMKDTYDKVTTSVVSSMAKEVVKVSIQEVERDQIHKKAVDGVRNDLLHECVRKQAKNIGKDAYREVEREERERKRREEEEKERKYKARKEMLHHIATSLSAEYISEFLASLLEQVGQESVREVEAEVWHEVCDNLTNELPQKLMLEVVQEGISKLGSEAITELTLELEEKIKEIQQRILLRKIGEHFRKWRSVVLRVRRRKQAQATFPASCSQLSLQEQNQAFSWGYNRKPSENISAELLMKLELDNTKMAEKLILRDQLVRAVAWYPLPIQQEMRKIAQSSSQQSNNLMKRYFKLLLCSSDDANCTVLHWLRSKLSGVENSDVFEPLKNTFSFRCKVTGLEFGCSIHEASINLLTLEDFSGTSAILFVTSETATQCSGYSEIQKLQRANPDIPSKTIICESKSSVEEESCGLLEEEPWGLEEEDLLVPETSQKLMKLVLGLWEKHASRIQIVSSPLNSFVSGFVASHYVEPSLLKQQERHSDGKSPLSPATYINLYNEVIRFLISVIKDEELIRLDWPPPELSHLEHVPRLSWNKLDIERTSKRVEQMKLPEIEIDGFTSWKALVGALYAYVDQISRPEGFSFVLWSHIESLLSNTSKILSSAYDLDVENPDVEIHILQLPWTELIYACVSYKLSNLTDTPVFYQPKTLRSFTYPRDWWLACDYSDPYWNEILNSGMINPNKRKVINEDEELEDRVKVPKLSSELLRDIAKETEKYEEFQKKLESFLDGDDDSTPFWNETLKENESCDELEPLNTSSKGEVLNLSRYEAISPDEEELKTQYDKGPGLASNLLLDIAQEKEKGEAFLRKLESMLDDG